MYLRKPQILGRGSNTPRRANLEGDNPWEDNWDDVDVEEELSMQLK